jgi:sucrose synthase
MIAHRWDIYASRLMTLTRVYFFWRHVTNLERQESKEYLEVLYKMLLRPMMMHSGPPATD